MRIYIFTERKFLTNLAKFEAQRGAVYCRDGRGSAEVFKPLSNNEMRQIRTKLAVRVEFFVLFFEVLHV